MKVLIIDDDADIRFVAAMSLRAGGSLAVCTRASASSAAMASHSVTNVATKLARVSSRTRASSSRGGDDGPEGSPARTDGVSS